MKPQWRKNVLALVGMGYMLMATVFLMLIFHGGMTADGAYDIVNGPIMALIGGSLAIAKDLIDGDQSEGPENVSKDDHQG